MYISISQLSEICQDSSICWHCCIEDTSGCMAAKPSGLSIWLHLLDILDAASLSLEHLSWRGFWSIASLLRLFSLSLTFPFISVLFLEDYMLSAFDLNEIPPAHSPLDLTWVLISMSVIFRRHRYSLIHLLFIINRLAFGTLVTALNLLILSVPYHVFHP